MDITQLLPAFVAIPSVPFLIGTPERELSRLAKTYGGTRESYREESPQHTLRLAPFEIAAVPVTNALYGAFVVTTGVRPPGNWHGPQPPTALKDHPVVDVSWQDAQELCNWVNSLQHSGAAIRLPTEAEWEHAARGVDGWVFPWGNRWDQARANTREAGLGHTLPVGSLAAGRSPYGCMDMAGNVWEWTSSLDAPYPSHSGDGREDPGAAGRRILRGGCYANPQGYARCACRFRLPASMRNEFLGFRLARGDPAR